MAKANFDPKTHGFHFANYFINQIANLPGIGQISTGGRCGGMSYATLDHYFAHVAMPAFTGNDFDKTGYVPPDGHPLSDYIYKRQLDSFMVLSAAKFVTWTLTRNEKTWFSKGVTAMTKQDEFAKFKANIDRGVPVTLGLIFADEMSEVAKNHQVVGYGYDVDAASGEISIYIYDVNYPDQENKLQSRTDEATWRESSPNHEVWRGWFVQDYSPRRPPDNLGAFTASMNTSTTPTTATGTRGLPMNDASSVPRRGRNASSRPRNTNLTVTLDRITFNNDEDADASDDVAVDFNIGGATLRWPSSGLKTVEDGKSYKLNKSFDVTVMPGGSLAISARPALTDAQQRGVFSGLIDAAHWHTADEALTGVIEDSYTQQDRWGIGTHSTRSTGAGGAYTLVYTISKARQ